MVVLVLMISCQVSENPNSGPVTAHITISRKAMMNVTGLPVTLVITDENRSKKGIFLDLELVLGRGTFLDVAMNLVLLS